MLSQQIAYLQVQDQMAILIHALLHAIPDMSCKTAHAISLGIVQIAQQANCSAYSSSASLSACLSCAGGTYTFQTGGTACFGCPSGTYAANGSATCINCSTGTYAASANSSACSSCTGWSFSNVTCATACYVRIVGSEALIHTGS